MRARWRGRPCNAAPGRGSRARGRPRGRSRPPARPRAARPRAARRRGSRPPPRRRAPAAPRRSIRATRPGRSASTPSRRRTCGTRLSANIVSAREIVERGATPASARSAAAICARLHSGTGRPPCSRRRRTSARPPRCAASATAEPRPRARARRTARVLGLDARARARAARVANRAISSWPGSCPSVTATASASISVSSAADQGPSRAHARRDGAGARQPGALPQRREPARAEVDRVEAEHERGARLAVAAGRQVEPRRAASPPERRGAYGAIAAGSISTCRARAATAAQAVRMSSTRATGGARG